MLYNVITDGDKTIYAPTTLGNVLLAIVLIALIAVFAAFLCNAVISRRKKAKTAELAETDNPIKASRPGRKKLTIKKLAFCAVAVALGTVLSNVRLYRFPFGGSVTLLSMLMVCLPGYWFGLAAGLVTGVAYGVLQLITNPYVVHPLQLIIEYLLAFGALGLSGLFSNVKHGLVKGYVTSIIGRWGFASLSGWIFFAEYAWTGWNPFLYSFTYNGIYIFSEAAITLIILALPPVAAALARVKALAAE